MGVTMVLPAQPEVLPPYGGGKWYGSPFRQAPGTRRLKHGRT
jgi:hypothetical protein